MKKSLLFKLPAAGLGLFLGLALLLPGSMAAEAIQDISAQINNNVTIIWDNAVFVPTDANGNEVPPIIYENRVYIPLRSFGVESGCTVSWAPETSTVTVISPKETTEASNTSASENETTPEVTADTSTSSTTYTTEFSGPRNIILDGEPTHWQYWMRFDNVYMEYHDAVALLRYCTGGRIYVFNYSPLSKKFVLNEKSSEVPYFELDGFKLINVSSIDNSYPSIEFNLNTETGEVNSL